VIFAQLGKDQVNLALLSPFAKITYVISSLSNIHASLTLRSFLTKFDRSRRLSSVQGAADETIPSAEKRNGMVKYKVSTLRVTSTLLSTSR
jgi:hypothetical protein